MDALVGYVQTSECCCRTGITGNKMVPESGKANLVGNAVLLAVSTLMWAETLDGNDRMWIFFTST